MRRILSTFQELGFGAGLAYLADRTLRGAGIGSVHHYVFLAQPTRPSSALNIGRCDFSCRRIRPGDPALTGLPLETGVADYRFDQGAIAVFACSSERPVASVWFTAGPFEEDEVHARYIPLPRGKAGWDFGVYVAEDFRLSRAFIAVWAAALTEMRGLGLEWTLSRVASVNRASLNAHLRLGGRRIGSALFVTISSLQLACATVPPFLNVSWRGRGRPVYRLTAPAETS